MINVNIYRLLQDKREAILRIAAKHGAYNVRLFGSVVRREARADSDVDFLVELRPGCSLLDHAAMQLELEELLGRKVDIVPERSLKARVRDRVLIEAVPL